MATVSCCLVVKNGAEKVHQCLQQMIGFANEIVVIDTGSSDGTISIINSFKASINIPMYVECVGDKFCDEDGDFNFGLAKTYSFTKASSDYVMWLDVSDKISDPIKLRRVFDKIAVQKPYAIIALPTLVGNTAFSRVRIGRRAYTWMHGRVHEFMAFNHDFERVFVDIPINNELRQRDLSRNLRLLEKDYKEAPDARICFYLANTYYDNNEFENAMRYYAERIEKYDNSDVEEIIKCLERFIEIKSKLNDLSDVQMAQLASNMIKLDPKKYDGYYYMAEYYRNVGLYERAIEFYEKIYELGVKSYRLWINPNIYNKNLIKLKVEACEFELEHGSPVEIESIEDFGTSSESTYKIGSNQYY